MYKLIKLELNFYENETKLGAFPKRYSSAGTPYLKSIEIEGDSYCLCIIPEGLKTAVP